MTPSDIIAEVRQIIQDVRVPYRYSDIVLVGFVNQTLKRAAMLRPDLFATIAEFSTTAGSVLQDCPTDSLRLIEIFQVKNGPSVVEVDRDTLNRTAPNWQAEPAGTPVNFMRHIRNDNRYFLYPAPIAGTVLIGEYAQTPPDYTLSQVITAPSEAYFTALVDGTVFLAESVDNEHVNAGRAKLFLDSFTQTLGAALQARTLTDTERAGLSAKEVMG